MAITQMSLTIAILIFTTAIIIAAFYYYRYYKIFLIAYTASISLYIYAVFYTWEIYQEYTNAIFIMLIVSILIMIFLGKHFSKIDIKPAKVHTSLKEKE